MSTNMQRLVGAAALALGLSAAIGLPAQAGPTSHNGKGTCAATSTYKLKAAVDDEAMIKVKATINTDAAGETWTYTIADNGTGVAAGEATSGKNGKVRITQTIADLEGIDTIDFTATDSVTGETCTAQAVVDEEEE